MGRRKSGEMPRVVVHAATGNARVRIAGRTHWLGRCQDGKVTPDQQARAAKIWHEHLTGIVSPPPAAASPETPAGITIAAIGLRFLDHSEAYFRTPDGGTTSSVDGIRMALRALFPVSDMPAAEFGPKALRLVMDAMVREGRPRVTVNRIAKTIRRMFKWAAGEEIVPVTVWQSLQAVTALQRGRTAAPELEPVGEVPDAVVDATLPHLPRTVACMVQIQRLTGARPGEVCMLRPVDIDRSGDVWIYRPSHHKLAWRNDGVCREIAIGPECQRILTPFLLRHAESFCFSPREVVQQGRRKPSRTAGEHYETASYRRAIHRACDAADIDRWSPNRLRHLRAGEIKERLGIEVAGAVLGHRHLKTTEVYADRRLEQALQAARLMG